jgi:predicted small metal-binding protein
MCQGRPVEWVSAYCPGETEEEVLQQAAEHAKEHGIRQVTPELIERVKVNIRDE